MNKSTKPVSKEGLFVVASLMSLIIIIIVTSVANAGLDPTKIFTKSNFSNLLINASITIFGIISSLPSGVVNTKQRINQDGTKGRYLQEFSDYNFIRSKIEAVRFKFSQWHHNQYLKEKKDKCINFLLERGINQPEEILHLSREQIIELKTSKVFLIGGKEIFYKALTPKQMEACLKVYDGAITVHKLPDFYFLYIDGRSKRSFYDQAFYESRDESLQFLSKVGFKIFIGFTITCIFTGLAVEALIEDHITKEVVFKMIILLFSRIFNAISSTVWGYLIGQETVYSKCYYINGKTQFLQQFDTDNTFVFKDVQELVKEEIFNERSQNELPKQT